MSYDLSETMVFASSFFRAFKEDVVLRSKNQFTWNENTEALNYFHSQILEKPANQCALAEYAISLKSAAHYLLCSNDRLNKECRQELDKHINNIINALPSTFPNHRFILPCQEIINEKKLSEASSFWNSSENRKCPTITFSSSDDEVSFSF